MRTSAPKSYAIHPLSGTLAPGATIDTEIVLLHDSDISAHKFLVNATRAPSDAVLTKEQWAATERACIQEHWLGATFVQELVDVEDLDGDSEPAQDESLHAPHAAGHSVRSSASL